MPKYPSPVALLSTIPVLAGTLGAADYAPIQAGKYDATARRAEQKLPYAGEPMLDILGDIAQMLRERGGSHANSKKIPGKRTRNKGGKYLGWAPAENSGASGTSFTSRLFPGGFIFKYTDGGDVHTEKHVLETTVFTGNNTVRFVDHGVNGLYGKNDGVYVNGRKSRDDGSPSWEKIYRELMLRARDVFRRRGTARTTNK